MSEYSLLEPTICGYYRSAVYLVSTNQELIPVTELTLENAETSFIGNTFLPQDLLNINENDVLDITIDEETDVPMNSERVPRSSTPKKKSLKQKKTFVPMDEGFTQLQELFGNYYDSHKLQYNLFKMNIRRFNDANKKWSRVNAQKKDKYFEFFSPVNWQKLQYTEKVKHIKFCDECVIKNIDIQASFPSTSIRFSNARKEKNVPAVYIMQSMLNLKKHLEYLFQKG